MAPCQNALPRSGEQPRTHIRQWISGTGHWCAGAGASGDSMSCRARNARHRGGLMSDRLRGKTTLITAAPRASGGRSPLLSPARARGNRHRHNEAKSPNSTPGRRGPPPRVTDDAAVAALAAAVPAPHVLINCAGFVHHGTILECRPKTGSIRSGSTCGRCTWYARGAAADDRRGGGAIVNIASVASSVKGVPNRFVYSATKAAIIGLTKSIAVDFVSQGIAAMRCAPARSTRRR